MIIPASAIWPRSATKPKGAPKTLSASDEPMTPSGAVISTIASREKLCSCTMRIVSVATSMIGNIAKIEPLPFSLSSIVPPVSIR